MDYESLARFIKHEMQMSHVYQPVMLSALLTNRGRASRETIARALVNEDRSQLEYYDEITRDMVGRVLTNRGIVEKDGRDFVLRGFEQLTPEQVEDLKAACDMKLQQYIARYGDAIWDHRRRSEGYVSGTIRYEVLKNAKFHCELCGISAEQKALQVDHIIPRNKGGLDEISNFQALCYSCNAMKRDSDETDFRKVRSSFESSEEGCPFCAKLDREMVLANSLAIVIRDLYPVTNHHMLVVPRRHVADYFDLGTAEWSACQRLMKEVRAMLIEQDGSIEGFNIGVNSGVVAGQTVMHAHIHLIPRRPGDCASPRGGVRGVIIGKADY